MTEILYGIKHYVAEAAAYAQGTEEDIAAFGGTGKSAKEYAESIPGKKICIKSNRSSFSFYEIYEITADDGSLFYTCYQGGLASGGFYGSATLHINFLVHYKDLYYNIQATEEYLQATPPQSGGLYVRDRQLSKVGVKKTDQNGSGLSSVYWTAYGVCDKPN